MGSTVHSGSTIVEPSGPTIVGSSPASVEVRSFKGIDNSRKPMKVLKKRQRKASKKLLKASKKSTHRKMVPSRVHHASFDACPSCLNRKIKSTRLNQTTKLSIRELRNRTKFVWWSVNKRSGVWHKYMPYQRTFRKELKVLDILVNNPIPILSSRTEYRQARYIYYRILPRLIVSLSYGPDFQDLALAEDYLYHLLVSYQLRGKGIEYYRSPLWRLMYPTRVEPPLSFDEEPPHIVV